MSLESIKKINKVNYNSIDLGKFIASLMIIWLSIKSFTDYGVSYFFMGTVYHFWYLLNIIYGTILGYILLSLFNRKTVLVISIILYVMGLFTYSYSWINLEFINVLFGFSSKLFEIWTSITRGFPLMFFGYIAGLMKDKFSGSKSWGLFVISMGCLTVEFLLLKFFTVNQVCYSYIIFTVPCEIFLFISMLNLSNFKLSEKVSKMLRNASTIIYCIHPIIITLFINIEQQYRYYIVAVISIVISVILVKLSNLEKLKILKYLY